MLGTAEGGEKRDVNLEPWCVGQLVLKGKHYAPA